MRGILLLCLLVTLAVALSSCRKSGSGNSSAQATANGPAVPPPLTPPAPSGPVVRPGTTRPRIVAAPITARNDDLWHLAHRAQKNLALVCARGHAGGLKQAGSVSHYYIPPGARTGDYNCRNGKAYFGQPLMDNTCLHPCRTLAADPRFYRPGEIIFFPSLVGLTCGTGRNKMIHDGFMVVLDNGNPEAINIEGRFATFWGRCNSEQNGFCLDEGAITMDFALTFSQYCRAWRPQDPLHHDDIKLSIYNQVRSEAARRGDGNAASQFDLDALIGIGMGPDGLLFRRQ